MPKLRLPFALGRPSQNTPATDAESVDIKHIDGINATTVQEALEWMRNNASISSEQSYTMEICIEGDTLLAIGETKHITFKVFQGFVDVTDTVDSWKIIRTSSNTQADAVWGARYKVNVFNSLTRTSNVSIDITWSDDPALNDLDPDNTVSGTVFKVTAKIGTEEITQTVDF